MDPVTPQPKLLSAKARKAEIERRLYNAYWRAWESVRTVYIFTPPGVGLKDPLPPIPRANGQYQQGGIRQPDGSVLWAQLYAPYYFFKQGLDDPVFEPAFRNAIPAGLWGGDFAPMGFPKEKITSFDMLRHIYKACQPKWAKPMMTQEEIELLPEELQELSGSLNPNGYDDRISLPMIVWRIREADPLDAEVMATREAIQYVRVSSQNPEDKAKPWRHGTVPKDWRAWRVELVTGMGPHPGEPTFWLAFAKSGKDWVRDRSPTVWLERALSQLHQAPLEEAPLFIQIRPGDEECAWVPSPSNTGITTPLSFRPILGGRRHFDPEAANAVFRWRAADYAAEDQRLIPESVYGWVDCAFHRGWHGHYFANRSLKSVDVGSKGLPYLPSFGSWFVKPTAAWIKMVESQSIKIALEEEALTEGAYSFVLERPADDATPAA